MFLSSARSMPAFAVGFFVCFLVLLSGCSSSKNTATETIPEVPEVVEPETMAPAYVWVDSTSAVLRTAAGVETNFIGSGGDVVYSSGSLDGSAVVLAVARGGRVELTYVDMASGASRSLQAAREPVIFTGAWSPDSRSFAFGYYTPVTGQGRNVIGDGTIKLYSTGDGQVRPIGCSASQAVVAWPSEDMLMVRNNDDMYGVSPADCGTRVTVDVRKWHRITPSPDGTQLAYILRDLAYNSDTRGYEPDSMLYVIESGQPEGTLVVGDRFRPRNMSWSPTGRDLAFDVLEKVGSEKRVIFFYELAADKRFVMNQPSEGTPSETHPVWPLTGGGLSFISGGESLMVRRIGESFPAMVDLGDGAGSAKKIVGWSGLPDIVLIVDDQGVTFEYNIATKASSRLGDGTVIMPGGRLR